MAAKKTSKKTAAKKIVTKKATTPPATAGISTEALKALPEYVKLGDFERPKFDSKDPVVTRWSKNREPLDESLPGYLEFELYYTDRLGWCMLTLHIRNASRRQQSRGVTTERSYAVALNGGELVTVGLGPHVLHKLTLYVRESRLESLKPLLKLYVEGLTKAGDYRDRLSTRRAQSRGFGRWF